MTWPVRTCWGRRRAARRRQGGRRGWGLPCAAACLLAGSAHAASPAGYTLAFSEEFAQAEGSVPDRTRWSYDLGAGGWGNAELENYVSDAEHAGIIADPDATDGRALQIQATTDGKGHYTSARIHTRGKVSARYGYIEARLRLPYGQGIWPAFWMMGTDSPTAGWPKCGEIDVMENIGRELSTVYGTLHGPGYSGGEGLASAYTLPDGARFRDGYHTFAIRWRPDAVTFLVDGTPYKTRTPADLPAGTSWVFNKDFYVILNLAVGGNWPGYPDATTVFPQTLRVDYIRFYRFEPPLAKAITLKSMVNGQYVSGGDDGNSPLIADHAAAGASEQFQVVDAGGGNVALRALANGRYVSATNGGYGSLRASEAAIGPSETFQWVDAGDSAGSVALKALVNGRYVCAENSGNSALIANRPAVATWESFAVTVLPDSIALRADAQRAAGAAGGLENPNAAEADRLNVARDGPSAARVDLPDAARLARRAAGLDPSH